MTHYKVYTGPTLTHEAGKRLEAAGLHVTLLGTEHVYVEANSTLAVLNALNTYQGYTGTWNHRDVQAVGGDR